MAQTSRVAGRATKIRTENGTTYVRYHDTDVVAFNDREIFLNTGGWKTVTTKTRMNQAANQFGLGFQVFQRDYEWFVHLDGTGFDSAFTGQHFRIERKRQSA